MKKFLEKTLEYYLMGFRNTFNYRDASCRSELNYFILFFSVVYIVGLFLGMYVTIFTAVLKPQMAPILFGVMFGIIFLYCIAHFLPYIALIYRRIKDIFDKKSRMVFSILIFVWLLQMVCVIPSYCFMFSMNNSVQPTPQLMLGIFLPVIFAQILSWVVIGFIIFLMAKKGNL